MQELSNTIIIDQIGTRLLGIVILNLPDSPDSQGCPCEEQGRGREEDTCHLCHQLSWYHQCSSWHCVLIWNNLQPIITAQQNNVLENINDDYTTTIGCSHILFYSVYSFPCFISTFNQANSLIIIIHNISSGNSLLVLIAVYFAAEKNTIGCNVAMMYHNSESQHQLFIARR